MRLFIGYDPAEKLAYDVAVKSLSIYSKVEPEPLDEEKLRAQGLYTRLVDKRGQMYDLPSNAPCSTEFASSRFLTPILCQSGWALFVDCDVIFLDDPRKLLKIADPSKAVQVVKHSHIGEGVKMGGMIQTSYSRKNWSSVMLFNCDHQANRRLTVEDVSRRPGRDLHGFCWLHDSEIGDLPSEWNWLVNVQEKPEEPKIAHYTNGGPWIKGWIDSPHDKLWSYYSNG